MQCQKGEIMAKVLNYGMVGGGPDAFIGDAHRRAISLDESARLVAGVYVCLCYVGGCGGNGYLSALVQERRD